MSVPVEAISIVIRTSTIEKKYKGGLSRFERDVNRTFCTDGRLARVGFMAAVDAARFVMDLEKHGFVYTQDDRCIDIAVLSQADESRVPCDWLELQRRSDGVAYCFLKGTEAGDIAVPQGWRPSEGWDRNTRSVSHSSIEDQLQFLRRESGVEVYFDKRSGKEVYLGRMYQDPPGLNVFTDYYKLGNELVRSYMELEEVGRRTQGVHGRDDRRIVEKGIEYLRIATITDPDNWAAYWFLGKAYQALADHAKAYGYFKSAYRMNPGEDVVCRELGRECLELGRTEEGVSITQAVLNLCPDDAGLVCNLGVALFLNGDLQEARRVVGLSLEQSPDDPIAKNLLAVIALVESGKRIQPRTLADLQKQR
jgi:tetratricopeptide (TPR) repeat protein